MITRTLLSIVLIFPCVSAIGQENHDTTIEPISTANLKRLHKVGETPLSARRIVRGSGGRLFILAPTASKACGARMVDESDFRVTETIAEGQRIEALAVSREGNLLAWDTRDRKHVTVQKEDGTQFRIMAGGAPSGIAFSPDGRILAIGCVYWTDSSGGGYSETRLFDLNGKLIRTLEKNGPGSMKPVFSPNGKYLAVGNRNYQTQIFNVETGKLLTKLDRRRTHEIAFSPDGGTLAAAYVDGRIGLWNVSGGKLLKLADSGCEEVYSLDWSPDGKLLLPSGLNGSDRIVECEQSAKAGDTTGSRLGDSSPIYFERFRSRKLR